MSQLNSALENAKNYQPSIIDDSTMSKKWIIKELTITEYLCKEYPHVSFRFLPGGILHLFGEQKQPVIYRYTLIHRPDNSWGIVFYPNILDEVGEMTLKIMKNHVTLIPVDEELKESKTLHLNKLNFKSYDNSK